MRVRRHRPRLNLFYSLVISAPGGGVPRKLVEGGRATRWSPDGSRIADLRPGAAAGDALYIADADATNERLLLPVRGGMHVHWPTWAHDGRWIYYVSSPNTANSEPAEIHRISAGRRYTGSDRQDGPSRRVARRAAGWPRPALRRKSVHRAPRAVVGLTGRCAPPAADDVGGWRVPANWPWRVMDRVWWRRSPMSVSRSCASR